MLDAADVDDEAEVLTLIAVESPNTRPALDKNGAALWITCWQTALLLSYSTG